MCSYYNSGHGTLLAKILLYATKSDFHKKISDASKFLKKLMLI